MIELPGVAAVWDALPQARVVGGAVRDTLIGVPITDIDFAVPLEPALVLARLRAAGVKAVPTGVAHGTVTAVVGTVGFEVTALRRDILTDGRHAVVEFTDDWEMDASRRDFTINAMSMTRDGEIFDYFGGRSDLAAGMVRFVGDAKARVAEDYLRIFRFFRFYARYGRGAADTDAIAAISALRDGVRRLSVERVWSELKRILQVDDPRPALALMQATGVLPMVVPLADIGRFNAVVGAAPPDVLLRVAALLPASADDFAERWKLSLAEHDRLLVLRLPNFLVPGASDAELRRALAEETAETLIGRTWLAQDDRPGWVALRARLAALERPVFPLQGRDVTKAGVAPGPRVGKILQEIYAWWKAGGCVADALACRERMIALLGGDEKGFRK